MTDSAVYECEAFWWAPVLLEAACLWRLVDVTNELS